MKYPNLLLATTLLFLCVVHSGCNAPEMAQSKHEIALLEQQLAEAKQQLKTIVVVNHEWELKAAEAIKSAEQANSQIARLKDQQLQSDQLIKDTLKQLIDVRQKNAELEQASSSLAKQLDKLIEALSAKGEDSSNQELQKETPVSKSGGETEEDSNGDQSGEEGDQEQRNDEGGDTAPSER